jgi:hypothetical protein
MPDREGGHHQAGTSPGVISLKKTEGFTSTLTDTLLPAVIIREHIQKILQAEDIETYLADIEKLEDLMNTEIDDEYRKDENEIKEAVKDFRIVRTGPPNRESYNKFRQYESEKRRQYEKRLIFRALINLAKRKGIWLVDEEEAIISHDKKKVTSTDGK